MKPLILAIDTSCDETSIAITSGARVISNVIFSQTQLHKQFGGVYPIMAKAEHQSKIQPAISLALARARLKLQDITAVAVTYGPGLAPALEVGIQTTKQIATEFNKPLIPVDHIEGHIYSAFVQNSKGNPKRDIKYPFLALVVSGGHTELIMVASELSYKIIGEKLDDAAGEALDKAARMLGLGYPGGAVLEKIAMKGNIHAYKFPIPMQGTNSYDFSYSGIKTAMKRTLAITPPEEIPGQLPHLAASYQHAIMKSIEIKLEKALRYFAVKTVVLGGGVAHNKQLTQLFRKTVRAHDAIPFTPPFPYLCGDNAAMIGVVAGMKYAKNIVLYSKKEIESLDRTPRAHLNTWVL